MCRAGYELFTCRSLLAGELHTIICLLADQLSCRCWQTLDQAEAERPEQLHYALEEIDRSGYYLFWFGGRYGWQPPAQQLNIESKRRPWLSDFRGSSTFNPALGEILFERAVLSKIEHVRVCFTNWKLKAK